MAVFYGIPYFDAVNSLSFYLLDPKYYDERLVLVQIQENIVFDPTNFTWSNNSHSIRYVTYWR